MLVAAATNHVAASAVDLLRHCYHRRIIQRLLQLVNFLADILGATRLVAAPLTMVIFLAVGLIDDE